MIDAVLSYHANPATCGVAKFNQQLAARLNVPHDHLEARGYRHPLVSVKFSEVAWGHDPPLLPTFSLFVHDKPAPSDAAWAIHATTVFAANAPLARLFRRFHPDVVDAFCPSTIQGNPHRAPLNILTFGMAHKLQLPHYQKLKSLLDASGQDYTVCLSTAVHEGSPWDAVADAGSELRAIFGDTLRELGYLADDALAKELKECSAVALFFDPALRANNTTFWAAYRSLRQFVITNLDADSPTGLYPTVYDISALTVWPMPEFGYYVGDDATERYSWDSLLALMGVGVQV